MSNTASFWAGADPAGIGGFGIAFLYKNGDVKCKTVSSVDQAMESILKQRTPSALGIDAPMWWSTGEGGGRMVDQQLRENMEFIRVPHSQQTL
ncbi:MAG: DUF429 domain-containing protein [Gammaproteobacteria bacterium]|nr:DUF429 domain-containing protein [Gammaproteobacteria bacterium]